MTLLIFLSPLLSASLSIPLFSSPSPPRQSAIPYWLKCTYSCILPLAFFHLSNSLLVATGYHFPTLQIKASRIGDLFFSLLFITTYCSVWNMLLVFDQVKMCLHNIKRQVHRVLLYLNWLKSLDQFICSLPAAETDVLNPERFMVYNIIWVKISSVQKLI